MKSSSDQGLFNVSRPSDELEEGVAPSLECSLLPKDLILDVEERSEEIPRVLLLSFRLGLLFDGAAAEGALALDAGRMMLLFLLVLLLGEDSHTVLFLLFDSGLCEFSYSSSSSSSIDLSNVDMLPELLLFNLIAPPIDTLAEVLVAIVSKCCTERVRPKYQNQK